MTVPVDRAAGQGAAAFGGLLIDRHLVNRLNLAVAEEHARREQTSTAEAIVALGFADEAAVYFALSDATGWDLTTLADVRPSELAVRLVPERVARRHFALPLAVDNRRLTFASCRPFDVDVERDFAFASGRQVNGLLARPSSLKTALDRAYPKQTDIEVLTRRLALEKAGAPDIPTIDAAPSESTIVELANHLLVRAVEMGASDVHIECTDKGASVRYRICGVLESAATLPPAASHPLRNRFKVMARADIAVRLKPQDGAFRLKAGSRHVDVRFSSLPMVGGEKLVMRIIDSESPLTGLDTLGYDATTLARLRRSLGRPDGLVLVTGPTGSGKTTALYAALDAVRSAQINIVSVEDPVERAIAGVTQIPVNSRTGNNFASSPLSAPPGSQRDHGG